MIVQLIPIVSNIIKIHYLIIFLIAGNIWIDSTSGNKKCVKCLTTINNCEKCSSNLSCT